MTKKKIAAKKTAGTKANTKVKASVKTRVNTSTAKKSKAVPANQDSAPAPVLRSLSIEELQAEIRNEMAKIPELEKQMAYCKEAIHRIQGKIAGYQSVISHLSGDGQ